MMIPSISSLFTSLILVWVTLSQAQDASLVGTWTSKSKKVITGPGFYNPVADKFIEPALTGISYSFTSDGWYEEAYYRAVANSANPNCPGGVMQWQHGRYTMPGNGSILLTPIAVDGRQLTSSCSYDNAIYERWSTPELITKYEIVTDAFHNVPRLNLFRFDGSPQQPLYKEYNSPQMLPTMTLNPTTTASATAKAGKRDISAESEEHQQLHEQQAMGFQNEPMNKNALMDKVHHEPYDADKFWWAGVGLIAIGGAMYMYPTTS